MAQANIAATQSGAKAETVTGKAIVAVHKYIIAAVRIWVFPARMIR